MPRGVAIDERDPIALLLLASFDDLQQGLALVDHSRDRAAVNAAAAGLLGLPAGEHRAGDVMSAIARLNARAIGAPQLPSDPALTDPRDPYLMAPKNHRLGQNEDHQRRDHSGDDLRVAAVEPVG